MAEMKMGGPLPPRARPPLGWVAPICRRGGRSLSVCLCVVAIRRCPATVRRCLPRRSSQRRHRICPSRRRDGFSGQPWLPHVATQICPLVTVGIVMPSHRRYRGRRGRCLPGSRRPDLRRRHPPLQWVLGEMMEHRSRCSDGV
ncbi:hypothetical protein ACLOJK_020032 [Asimina triloba]